MPHKFTYGSPKTLFFLITTLTALAACGASDGDSSEINLSPASEAATEVASSSDPDKMFDESVKEDKCALLTPAQVAAVASVPESAVEQSSAACLYKWENANIYLSSVRVHDSIERASKYYDRNTQDFTAEEMRASKEELKQKMDESDSGSGISETLIDAAPEDAVSHQRWDDIGSEAAWDGNSVMIRYGNVTVKFSGKTYDRAEGEDWVPPEIAKGVARAIVANLDQAG